MFDLDKFEKYYIRCMLCLGVWCGAFILLCSFMLVSCLFAIVQHQSVFAVFNGVVYVLCLFTYILLVVDILEEFK